MLFLSMSAGEKVVNAVLDNSSMVLLHLQSEPLAFY
jgi:hypothetical protein